MHIDPTIAYQTNCNQYDYDRRNRSLHFCVDGNLIRGCRNCYGKKCIHTVEIANHRYGNNTPSVNFVFTNMKPSNEYHPIHLHGHSYHVVKIGYGTYNPPSAGKDPTVNSTTPVIRCDDNK